MKNSIRQAHLLEVFSANLCVKNNQNIYNGWRVMANVTKWL